MANFENYGSKVLVFITSFQNIFMGKIDVINLEIKKKL